MKIIRKFLDSWLAFPILGVFFIIGAGLSLIKEQLGMAMYGGTWGIALILMGIGERDN